MKCGITLAKQQKIQVLQKSNADLQKQLATLLAQYDKIAVSGKDKNKLINSLESQIEMETARNQIITKALDCKQKQLEDILKTNKEQQDVLNRVKEQNKCLNCELYQQSEKSFMQEQINERLSNELKKFGAIGSSNANIVKTTQKLKENHECLVRKLAIFQKKLESHYRYLDVLKKKKHQKEEEEEIQKTKKNNQNTFKPNIQPKNTHFNNKIEELKPQQNVTMQKKSVKQYDAMVRRKNEIIMKNKKK